MSIELRRLVTLRFDKNVGAPDRVFRLASGAALTASGWYFGWPMWATLAATVLGLMWTATGVLSKCSIYYLLGYSTCPLEQRNS